jgi:isocitrate dehydrogenase (NAD+)
VTQVTVNVIDQRGVKIAWEIVRIAAEVIEEFKASIPSYVLESIKKNRNKDMI